MDQIKNRMDLYRALLRDIYSAEVLLTPALRFFEEKASAAELSGKLHLHITENRMHVLRLEELMEKMGDYRVEDHCRTMKSMIREAQKLVKQCKPGVIMDLAISSSLKRINQCLITVYEMLSDLAHRLDIPQQVQILSHNLEEERSFKRELDNTKQPATQ